MMVWVVTAKNGRPRGLGDCAICMFSTTAVVAALVVAALGLILFARSVRSPFHRSILILVREFLQNTHARPREPTAYHQSQTHVSFIKCSQKHLHSLTLSATSRGGLAANDARLFELLGRFRFGKRTYMLTTFLRRLCCTNPPSFPMPE